LYFRSWGTGRLTTPPFLGISTSVFGFRFPVFGSESFYLPSGSIKADIS
jgi:hypothetical protein